MLNRNTMAFPFAELFAMLRDEVPLVSVEKPVPAFNVLPAKEVT